MSRKKQEIAVQYEIQTDEVALFQRISEIIENRKNRAGEYANREITLMYWEVGEHIRSSLLSGIRAKYSKRIVATLSQQLVAKYGAPKDDDEE